MPAAVKLGVAGQATTAPTTPPSSFPVKPYRLQSSSPVPTGQGTFIIDPLTPDDSPTSDYLSVPASEYMSAADDLSVQGGSSVPAGSPVLEQSLSRESSPVIKLSPPQLSPPHEVEAVVEEPAVPQETVSPQEPPVPEKALVCSKSVVPQEAVEPHEAAQEAATGVDGVTSQIGAAIVLNGATNGHSPQSGAVDAGIAGGDAKRKTRRDGFRRIFRAGRSMTCGRGARLREQGCVH